MAAYKRRKLWKYLKKLNFDVGLFQEVYMIPYEIRKNYHTVRGEMNAILLSKSIFPKVKKENILQVDSMNDRVFDFSVSCETVLSGNKLVLISIYNYIGASLDDFAEFMEIIYDHIKKNNKIIIIGGDFNMDKRFKKQLKHWGLLAMEIENRLSALGFKDVLEDHSEYSFTFITPTNKKPYQIDYLFIPKSLRVPYVYVADENEIFNTKPRLSDHLPILATVEI